MFDFSRVDTEKLKEVSKMFGFQVLKVTAEDNDTVFCFRRYSSVRRFDYVVLTEEDGEHDESFCEAGNDEMNICRLLILLASDRASELN